MEGICITDVPYLEVVSKLLAAGYRYIQTPISWRRTAEYVQDLPDDIGRLPAAALRFGYNQESVGIWPWIDGGANFSTQPLTVLRRDEPKQGLGVYAPCTLIKFSEFGPESHFVCCAVHRAGNLEEEPIMMMWEPANRASAVINPENWTAETEEAFCETVWAMCALWLDEDYLIVWNPATAAEYTETITKARPEA